MNRKELTMMISNWKKTFGLQGFHKKKFSASMVKAPYFNPVDDDIYPLIPHL